MKKYIAFIVSLALVFSFVLPSYAANNASAEKIITLDNGFQITETVKGNNLVVRTFENNLASPSLSPSSVAAAPKISNAEMEDILLTLGFVEEELAAMSAEDLSIYASSPKIQVSSAYYAVDEAGGTVPITETQAIQGAAAANNASESGDITTSYMYLYFTAIDLNDSNGSFRFGTTAQWLSMPGFRGEDAIGSCAQLFTVTPGTQEGFYSYKIETYTGTVLSSTVPVNADIVASAFDTSTDGTFYGCGAFINIPNDSNTDVMSTKIVDYTVHVQYDGKVNLPDQRINYNTTGTYAHSTPHLSLESPSLSIDTGRTIAGAIAINVSFNPEYLYIPLEIEYVP